MATRNIWTEEKIVRKTKAGDGLGVGKNYRPWISATEFSSNGRSRKVYGYKTQRVHHLLSDVEHNLFLALEWQTDVTDIREQFPLPRETTLAIAEKAGLRHPYYPGTSVPTVMTVDFLVTKKVAGKETLVAFNAKRTDEAEETKSLEKLEIQRRVFDAIDVEHHLVYHTDIPLLKTANIQWIRSGVIHEGIAEPEFENYWEQTLQTFQHYIQRHGDSSVALNKFCAQFDELHGLESGVGLRAARALMYQRTLLVDLAQKSIASAPVRNFVYAGHQPQRAVGGV